MSATLVLGLLGVGAIVVLGIILYFKSRKTEVAVDEGKGVVTLSKIEREERQKVIDELQAEEDKFEEEVRVEKERISNLKRVSAKHKEKLAEFDLKIAGGRAFIEYKKKELGLE